jgi:DNA-binding CsgD family transcriptional regulator
MDRPRQPTLPRATVLRGRDAELAAVAAALAELDRGRGQVLFIEGPPGIGKTALLAEAGGMAERAGARVLVGEAFESQQTVPFAPLLAALSTGERPVVDKHTARQLEDATDARYWLVHDLQSALEIAAARSPLVISIDDLQWADNATLRALRSLVPALTELPLLWTLSARTGRRRRAVPEILTWLEQSAAVRLRIGGLTPEAVAAIIGDLVQGEADTTLTALAERAQGSPFVLVELLRGLREEGRLIVVDGRATVVGNGPLRRLTASMSDRLAALSADAEQVVRVAATLSPRFSAAQLAAVLRLPPSTLVAPLEETLDADLLADAGEHLRFRHDLLRQAVLETMPRSLRRALQRDAVGVLLASGATPAEVALQLADSAELGDGPAVATLRNAARSIAGSDAVAAADLSMRALALLPAGDVDRGLLTAETVVLLHRARRSDEAQALADRALAGVLPPREEAEVRLSLSSMMTRSTFARAQENRRALALSGLTPLIRGRHLAWLAYNLGVGGEPTAATSTADSALDDAGVTGDRETRVMAGLAHACADGAGGTYIRSLSRIDDLRRVSHAHDRSLFGTILDFHRAHTLAVLGRLDEARVLVVDGVVSARDERDSLVLTAWTQFAGLLSLAAGRLSDARAEVVPHLPAEEEPVADTFGGVVRMVVLSELGAHLGDGALLRAGRATARKVGADTSPAVRRLATRLLARTASGPGSAAEAARLLADDPLAPATPLVPNDLGYHAWVARVARASAATDLAERAAVTAESLDRQNPGVPLFSGLARHTRGLVADDAAMLVDAARLLESTQRPLLAAAASEDAGRALAERRKRSAAVDHLNAAFDTYAMHGATADARRVGRVLRRLGVARRLTADRPENGWASLTGSELQVVRIIAAGATNRSAAEQLYVSPHTVSSHLRSAFTKLGINSRVQLARVLAEVEP